MISVYWWLVLYNHHQLNWGKQVHGSPVWMRGFLYDSPELTIRLMYEETTSSGATKHHLMIRGIILTTRNQFNCHTKRFNRAAARHTQRQTAACIEIYACCVVLLVLYSVHVQRILTEILNQIWLSFIFDGSRVCKHLDHYIHHTVCMSFFSFVFMFVQLYFYFI